MPEMIEWTRYLLAGQLLAVLFVELADIDEWFAVELADLHAAEFRDLVESRSARNSEHL